MERFKFILGIFFSENFIQYKVDNIRGAYLAQVLLSLSGNDYEKTYDALRRISSGESLAEIFSSKANDTSKSGTPKISAADGWILPSRFELDAIGLPAQICNVRWVSSRELGVEFA